MRLNLTALGRRTAQGVCIVSQLPVTLQLENKRARGKRIHTLRLDAMAIVVRQLPSGEQYIEIRPP